MGHRYFFVLAAIGSMQENKDTSESATPQQTERVAEQPPKAEAGSQASEKKEEAERQAREKEEEEKNPYAKFAGTYRIYDDKGNEQFSFFKVTEDGRFCQSVVNISLDHGRRILPEFNVKGKITSVSGNTFVVDVSEKIWMDGNIVNGEEERPWANKGDISCAVRYKTFETNMDLVFDISEKKMYPDKKEYDNRDLKAPYFYKFKFAK